MSYQASTRHLDPQLRMHTDTSQFQLLISFVCSFNTAVSFQIRMISHAYAPPCPLTLTLIAQCNCSWCGIQGIRGFQGYSGEVFRGYSGYSGRSFCGFQRGT